MEAKELRIGNYYFYKDNLYPDIFELEDFVDLDSGNVEIYDWKPIPLTEEWLVKFGLNKKNYKYWTGYFFKHLNTTNNLSVDVAIKSKRFSLCKYYEKKHSDIILLDLLYVHQLQNLYFCLTGEELTIDETQNKVENCKGCDHHREGLGTTTCVGCIMHDRYIKAIK